MPVRTASHCLATSSRTAAFAAALLLGAAVARADDAPVLNDVTPAGLADPNTNLRGVDYGNGVFVANGGFFNRATGTVHNVTFTSVDGGAWEEHTQNFSAGGRVRFAKGRFLLFGAAPTQFIYSSPDGVNWTSVADPEISSAATGVAEGNGLAVAARTSLSGIESDATADDASFTPIHLPNTSGFTASTGIAFGAGQFAFVAAGIAGPFYFTSPDAQTWTAQPGLDYPNGFTFIAYGNGTYLAQENGLAQHVSPDGINWTLASPGYRHEVPGIGTINMALRFGRFLNGRFIALTNNDTVGASLDAQNWTSLATLPAGVAGAEDVAFGAGHYVVIDGKHILTDGAGAPRLPSPGRPISRSPSAT